MQLIGKVIILFLIIFKFRIPVVYDTTFLSILLCSIYYLFTRKAIPFTYFFWRYSITIFVGLFLFCCIFAFVTIVHAEFDFIYLSILAFQFIMLFALVYALPFLLEDTEEPDVFGDALYLVCLAFAVQGFIQLMAFIIPSFGDYMISIKPIETRDTLLNSSLNVYFRGYALSGSIFFELPAGFGVAFIAFIRILFIKNQKYITGYKGYIMFFLFVFGSALSGRTAFVGLIVSLVLGIMFIKNPTVLFFKILKPAAILIFSGIILYTVLPSRQRIILEEHIFPFAFEFYYKYELSGKMSTGSTDVMIHDHYFKLPDEIIMQGTGRYVPRNGNGFYMNTDAGYMRNVIFGGIFYLLCVVFYQFLYFIKPLSITSRLCRTKEGYEDFMFFLAVFLYLFILEYKGSALAFMNIMQVLLLFFGMTYLIRHYYRKESEESEENEITQEI